MGVANSLCNHLQINTIVRKKVLLDLNTWLPVVFMTTTFKVITQCFSGEKHCLTTIITLRKETNACPDVNQVYR